MAALRDDTWNRKNVTEMMTSNPIINEMEKPVASEKIYFTQEETMLMTLYARAMQSLVLPDQWAEEGTCCIDYGFSNFKVGKIGTIITAIRAKNFDLLTTQRLAAGEPTFNTRLVRSGRMA